MQQSRPILLQKLLGDIIMIRVFLELVQGFMQVQYFCILAMQLLKFVNVFSCINRNVVMFKSLHLRLLHVVNSLLKLLLTH